MSYEDFLRMFPTDDVCLEYLKERYYPDRTPCPGCGRPSKFHRIRGRTAYSCQLCGAHVYPTAGTVFHRSRAGLKRWFEAVYLISATRGRITPQQLARELDVSANTARRMSGRVRMLLAEVVAPVSPAPPVWHGTRRRT